MALGEEKAAPAFTMLNFLVGSGSESDFSGDIRRVEIRLNSVTVVLLHRDVLVASDRARLPDETSVKNMLALSAKFFAPFAQSSMCGKAGRQHAVVVEKNHFR